MMLFILMRMLENLLSKWVQNGFGSDGASPVKPLNRTEELTESKWTELHLTTAHNNSQWQ